MRRMSLAFKDDTKILIISAVILITIASIAGLTGFGISERNNEIILRKFLPLMKLSVDTKNDIISQSLHHDLIVALPLVFLTIVFGLLLLYWQVLPLVRRVVRSEAKLKESENRFRLSFDSAPTGMALTAQEDYWMRVNPALCQMLGYSEDELLKIKFCDVVFPEDLEAVVAGRNTLLNSNHGALQLEVRCQREDKSVIWVVLSVSLVRDALGKPKYFIDQIQDITAKKKAELALSYQAYYDALTGLVNRNQLEQSLSAAISSALHQQKNFAVFFIDIDHFKKINDTLGHDAGDQLLKAVADRLKSNTRVTDVAARMGGDEFILILNGVNTKEIASGFSEKIIQTIVQPILINEKEVCVSISIGISFFPMDGMDYLTLMKSADQALYRAKEMGRNTYQFCKQEAIPEIENQLVNDEPQINAKSTFSGVTVLD